MLSNPHNQADTSVEPVLAKTSRVLHPPPKGKWATTYVSALDSAANTVMQDKIRPAGRNHFLVLKLE